MASTDLDLEPVSAAIAAIHSSDWRYRSGQYCSAVPCARRRHAAMRLFLPVASFRQRAGLRTNEASNVVASWGANEVGGVLVCPVVETEKFLSDGRYIKISNSICKEVLLTRSELISRMRNRRAKPSGPTFCCAVKYLGLQSSVRHVCDVISGRDNLPTFFVCHRHVIDEALDQRRLPHQFLGRKRVADLSVAFKQCVRENLPA